MFTNSHIIHRNTVHYRIWEWTYRNWIWKAKKIPTHKSLCPYWHRIIWIGMLAAILHLIYAPFRIVFYSILYKLAGLIFKNEIVAGFVVWISALWLISISGSWVFFPWFVGGILHFLLFAAIFFGLVFVFAKGISWPFKKTALGRSIKGFFEDTFFPAIGSGIRWVIVLIFKWVLWGGFKLFFYYLPYWAIQIIGRYYTPKEQLRTEKYELNGVKNQLTLQLLFWLGFLGVPVLAFFGGNSGYIPIPEIVRNPGWSTALIVLGIEALMVLAAWILVRVENKKFEQELVYIRFPELRPEEKPSVIKKLVKTTKKSLDHNVTPFIAWIKAIKQKVCPIMTFVD